MSSPALAPPPETEPAPCPICEGPACACGPQGRELARRARRLLDAGLAAAREGSLWRAHGLLGEWAGLDGRDATGLAVRGIVAAALGDARAADDAWGRLPGDARAAAWLAELRGGALRRAFEHYNAAVAAARALDPARAGAEVERALSAFPDLVPARRLKGLLVAAAGDLAQARASWSALVERCGDDADAMRFLAAATTASPAGAPLAAPAVVSAGVPAGGGRTGRRRWAAAGVCATLSAAVLVALALGRGDSARTGPRPAPVPAVSAARASAVPAAPPVVPRPRAAFDLDAYRAARVAFAARDWAGVRDRLSGAVGGDPGAYFHDDALYLLARADLAAGDSAAARTAAVELLALHPESIFVNRITRSLVGLRR